MSRRVHSGAKGPLIMIAAVLVGLAFPLALPAPVDRAAVRQDDRPVIGPATGDELHVMSFNLRFASTSEPHSWKRRRPVVAELLGREQPTVLATQEGLYGQLKDVDSDLPEAYEWIGVGRGGGSRDEFMAVFYDTRRLEPLEFDHFWLSDTPEVIGSKSWGNGIVRMVTWVRFADRRTGVEFVVFNTHLDQSEYPQRRAAALIRDRIATFSLGVPVVLAGDFNAPAERSATYDLLSAGMADTWRTAAERRTPVHSTWHGYRPLRPDGDRIDWILTRGRVSVRAAAINTFSAGGEFPSDHLPVQALVTIG
ncbi:endonuclease/exonuclease/phosphatase family protein [Actinophytocola xanthii]|uniref:Endonuclease n=1 Tax=Actinophytocola xanthii TaxID=1912961 RepID=A0A1Q8CJV5_9PSEU|nr:endonuclease/exonuclease/phosphatase family protein [Actinophytocola xanthii]OLF14638.1 endonuclease [Actinophytocola xanthii]